MSAGLGTGRNGEATPPPATEAEPRRSTRAPATHKPRPKPGADEAIPAAPSTSAVDRVVETFNSRYMLVNEMGRAVIFQPTYDPVLKRRRHDRISPQDLRVFYANDLVEIGRDDKDRPVLQTSANVWLKHPRRRQYIHGVTFDPNRAGSRDGVLNLWEGFAVTPRRGTWAKLREHIRAVICGGVEDRFDYLMHWMARMVQRPAEPGEVAIVLRGGEGTGKGTLAKALRRIMGQHALAISSAKHLVGNFNAHLRDTVFLFADEAFFAGDKGHVGTLKSLITEEYLTIEGKFANAIQAPNFLHVLMASNEEWVVPASMDARRFLVLEVGDAHKGDHAYFAAIWEQMEAGGYEAMLHDLLALDLSTFNVRAVPTTEGLQQQRKLSLGTTERWWLDCLERGYVYASKLGLEEHFEAWTPRVTTELLYLSYGEYARSRNERRVLSREQLGRFMSNMGARATQWRKGMTGEHITEETNPYGGTLRVARPRYRERPTGYAVGTLMEARDSFIVRTGLEVTWDAGVRAEDYEDEG